LSDSSETIINKKIKSENEQWEVQSNYDSNVDSILSDSDNDCQQLKDIIEKKELEQELSNQKAVNDIQIQLKF